MNLKRTLHLLKCRLQVLARKVAEEFFKFLAKLDLVVEHKKSYCNIVDSGLPQRAPDITSDRFKFSVSYLIRNIETVNEYWFESKKGKKLFVVYADRILEHKICYRAELRSFFAHFSHRQRLWVHKHSPVVYLHEFTAFDPISDFSIDAKKFVEAKTHRCDFSQCRYAFEFKLSLVTLNLPIEEVIAESYKVLRNGLNEKVVEINKLLTGVDNDGAMTSKNGMPLSDNIVCRACGYPVFASAKDNYGFECIHHGEIEYIDCDKVDPKKYEVILENCMFELEQFCECPQD